MLHRIANRAFVCTYQVHRPSLFYRSCNSTSQHSNVCFEGHVQNFTTNQAGYVVAYTDGACKSNGTTDAKAGIGVWFGNDHPMNLSEPIAGNRHTNNSAEIQAAERAILIAKEAGITKVNVKTDSRFLINCMTKWIHEWRRNNWKLANGKSVKNREDLEKLISASKDIKIIWSYVPAHTGVHGNIEADRLAVEGCGKQS